MESITNPQKLEIARISPLILNCQPPPGALPLIIDLASGMRNILLMSNVSEQSNNHATQTKLNK